MRIDLLFKDADGDLDIELFDENFNEIATATAQVMTRPSSRFAIEGGTTFEYSTSVLRTAIAFSEVEFDTTRTEVDVENGMIPDAMGDQPGVLEIPVTFPNAPPGSIVRNLVIRRLLITHPFLPNLRVSGKWDAEELAVFWNQQGDAEGGDNGEDDDNDDFLPGFSTDLDFGRNFFRTRNSEPSLSLPVEQPMDSSFSVSKTELRKTLVSSKNSKSKSNTSPLKRV